MKRFLILFACILLLNRIGAQPIRNGGFGYFMTGPAFVFSSKIDNYLSTPAVLGASYSSPNVGLQSGGEGFAMINRVLLGGGGYGITHFRQSGDSGSVIQSGGGGYFKVGYVVWSNHTSFMATKIGFGGFGHSYSIRNDRSKSGIYFNQEFPVNLGETKTYSYGGTSFDFSYGIQTVVGNHSETKVGGFMIGAEAGCLLYIATGDWNGPESVVVGPPAPGVTAMPYIRITIGGGGFKMKSS